MDERCDLVEYFQGSGEEKWDAAAAKGSEDGWWIRQSNYLDIGIVDESRMESGV